MKGTLQAAVNAVFPSCRVSAGKAPSNEGAARSPAIRTVVDLANGITLSRSAAVKRSVTCRSPPLAAISAAAGAETRPYAEPGLPPALAAREAASGVGAPPGEPSEISEAGANAICVLPPGAEMTPTTSLLAPRRSEKPTTIRAACQSTCEPAGRLGAAGGAEKCASIFAVAAETGTVKML